MIRDTHLRIVFIPLLGIGLPLVAGLITYELYTIPVLLLGNFFFILTSWCIWMGSKWMHLKLRVLFAVYSNPFKKIAMVCIVQSFYGACIGGISAFIWIRFSDELFQWNTWMRFILICMLAVVLFTLVYEILFLSKERELDSNKVLKLDKEKSQAEWQALANEMDPHFIFNSLNALNYLIVNEPAQAQLFNERLALVYKYFLVNKGKELISLSEELAFVENYYFLLQIRHDNKLSLHTELHENCAQLMIPPFALQLLVENAIKHNQFSDQHPLHVSIVLNNHYLKVSNNLRAKSMVVCSTGIGLRNLRRRYQILSQKDILIESTASTYTVKLPLIR